MNSSQQFNKIDFSNINLLNNTYNQQPQRSTTPPKKPAVLCRKSSNTPKQNTLLSNSNNKNVVNMPSPLQINFQNLQISINSQLDINQSQYDQKIQTPNSFENQNQKVQSCTATNIQQNNFIKKSPIVTNSFVPLNQTQGLDARSSSLHKPQQNYNDQNHSQHIQEIKRNNLLNQNINNQKELIQQPNLSSKQTIQLQDQSFERGKASTYINSNNNSFIISSIDQNKQEFLENQQQQYHQQNSYNQQPLIQQQQSLTQVFNQNKVNNSERNFFFNSENVTSPKQQQVLQQNLQEQSDSNNSYNVMMQLSNEIERMNNEVKNKNKEFLQLQVKYETLIEQFDNQQNQYDNILNQKEIMLQSQIQINQNSQLQINSLLQEIERLNFTVNNFSNMEHPKPETSTELRQKIEKLIQMNENLLIENKELGEENMFLNQEMQKCQQERETLTQKITDQSQKLSTLREEIIVKNEEILEKETQYKISHEKEKKEEKQNEYEQNNIKSLFQKQLQSYEEEIESMKYLLKEKIQELEFWKMKSEGNQNDYNELEQRLLTALNCNQILNNKLANFAQIDIMKSTSEEQSQQYIDSNQFEDQTESEQQQLSEEYQFNIVYANQKENNGNKQLSSDRYQLLKDKNREIQGLYGQNKQNAEISPRLSSRYGISQSQYQNRISGLQNIPLKECVNKINIKDQKKSLNNDIIESTKSKNKNLKLRK